MSSLSTYHNIHCFSCSELQLQHCPRSVGKRQVLPILPHNKFPGQEVANIPYVKRSIKSADKEKKTPEQARVLNRLKRQNSLQLTQQQKWRQAAASPFLQPQVSRAGFVPGVWLRLPCETTSHHHNTSLSGALPPLPNNNATKVSERPPPRALPVPSPSSLPPLPNSHSTADPTLYQQSTTELHSNVHSRVWFNKP